MNSTLGWRLAYGLLIALYPLLVYLSLGTFNPRWISILLILLAAKHLLSNQFSRKTRLWLGLAIATIALYTLLTGSQIGLFVYPVLVNAVLLVVFFISWLRPPSIIEQLARMREPDLPASGVRYTRKLTMVWCVFFVCNGSMSLFSLSMGREWWALYNGLLAYILMGILFFGEMLFRKRLRGQEIMASD